MRAGTIYLLETAVGIKIGRTSRGTDKRMKELSIAYNVKFIHAIFTHDAIALEKELHKRYRSKRILGVPSTEIFALSLADVLEIQSIRLYRGRNCVHFHDLVELTKYETARRRGYYLREYGR